MFLIEAIKKKLIKICVSANFSVFCINKSKLLSFIFESRKIIVLSIVKEEKNGMNENKEVKN